jgi:hypothetical protein
MSPCECDWINNPGPCACQPETLPVTTPAKACKIRLKTEKDRDASPKSVTASKLTPIKE